MSNSSESPQPLSGIRVLDLTSNISGPSATAILADLGAEVIKIERPGQGDDARSMGPFLHGESAYFLAINRNKKSVVIDIQKAEGQKLIRKLTNTVDILVENFRRGVLTKYGLDGPALCALNPRLIYCSLSAYGEEGPDAAKPGYDAVVQARTGIMSITGSRQNEPARAGVSILDMGSGMWSVIAILSALLHRSQTGEGQLVGTSLFETGIYWMNYHLTAFPAMSMDPVPQGTSHTAFAPYGAYQTADDLLLLGISNDSLFSRLTQALEREELAADRRFIDNASRLHHRQELDRLLNDCFLAQPCSYWVERLDAKGVPCSRIQKVSQVWNDPQVKALEMMPAVCHTTLQSVKVPRLPIRMQKSPTKINTGAPILGEHTSEVLRQLGVSEQEIEDFRINKVIGS
ncbi:CaiB/BaiF CoA-transferase family protein [Brevibacillus sp. Leaf182]|uniref:CaiB/BaiF CoA transferase family protein n=1 Tax=Brevibacillus sp. Leaf182 TaxID=1736290 RepID=UPI0006F693F1|nr:CaiB/BaiF CoA-transferase family protein [Brevibacillus sp. Leaf182]RAT94651.1 CoA transferase [Brevibacillus sp. Leaf182]